MAGRTEQPYSSKLPVDLSEHTYSKTAREGYMFEGDDQLKVHEVEGESLRYLAVEPAGYDPETSYPLIILLHGYGANMGDLAGLCPAIGANGYVYAFPNAPIPLEIGLDGYAWLVPPDLNGDQMAPATAEKLMSFVDEVVERYNVKPAKAHTRRLLSRRHDELLSRSSQTRRLLGGRSHECAHTRPRPPAVEACPSHVLNRSSFRTERPTRSWRSVQRT